MKYQQLENLESGWKWKYLVKKHREGELITRYVEASAAKEAVDLFAYFSLCSASSISCTWFQKAFYRAAAQGLLSVAKP